MNEYTVICHCLNITSENIKDAIEDGASSFEEVQAVTKVSKACRRCSMRARDTVKELLYQKSREQ